MILRRAVVGSLLLLLVAACHGRHVGLLEDDAGSSCDGSCAPRFDSTCPTAKLPTADGSCGIIGVVACGSGFDADGQGGCSPRLDACAGAGQVITPGGTCHPVTSCDTSVDRWGGLPASNVVYVDAASPVPSPDGSAARPFTRISDALASGPGIERVVALRPGTYAEDVSLDQGALWGPCDGVAEIVGTSASRPAVHVGSVGGLRHVAVHGPGPGIDVGSDTTISGVWVHDTGGEGIVATSDVGAVLTIEDSLVENAVGTGLHYRGSGHATMALVRSVVRATRPITGKTDSGRGVWIENATSDTSMKVTLDGCDLDDNSTAALDAGTATIAITASLLRRTRLLSGAPDGGYGVRLVGGSLQITGSVLAENVHAGVFTTDVREIVLENVVVRDTSSDPTLGLGIGVHVVGGHLRLANSLVSNSYGDGVLLEGAQGDVSFSLVTDTHEFGSIGGLGIGVHASYDGKGHASGLTMHSTSVVSSVGIGVLLAGSTGDLEDCAIRKTSLSASPNLGNGLFLSAEDGSPPTRSIVTVNRSLIERSAGGGVQLLGSTLFFNASVVDGCAVGAVLAGAQHGQDAQFTPHDGSQCGCSGDLEDCTTTPSLLGP